MTEYILTTAGGAVIRTTSERLRNEVLGSGGRSGAPPPEQVIQEGQRSGASTSQIAQMLRDRGYSAQSYNIGTPSGIQEGLDYLVPGSASTEMPKKKTVGAYENQREQTVTISGNFRGPGGKIISEEEFKKIQDAEAQRIVNMMPYSSAGKKDFAYGVEYITTTPDSVKQIILIDKQAYERSVPAPEGSKFTELGTKQSYLKSSVDIPTEAVTAYKANVDYEAASRAYDKMGPLMRSAAAVNTLLKPEGYDLIMNIGNRAGSEAAVKSSIARTSKKGYGPIDIAWDLANSPIGEIEGGMAIGGLAATKTGGKVVGSRIGKGLIVGAGAAYVAPRAYEIGGLAAEGRTGGAVGMTLLTAASLGAAGTSLYKTPKKETTTFITGIKKSEMIIEVKSEGIAESNYPIVSIEKNFASKDIMESFDTKTDMKGLKKAGYVFETKDVITKVGTINVKSQDVMKYNNGLFSKSPKEKTFYVKREEGTGKFVRFGLEKNILRDVGLKEKFEKIPDNKAFIFEGKAVGKNVKLVGESPKSKYIIDVTLIDSELKPIKAEEMRYLIDKNNKVKKGTLGFSRTLTDNQVISLPKSERFKYIKRGASLRETVRGGNIKVNFRTPQPQLLKINDKSRLNYDLAPSLMDKPGAKSKIKAAPGLDLLQIREVKTGYLKTPIAVTLPRTSTRSTQDQKLTPRTDFRNPETRIEPITEPIPPRIETPFMPGIPNLPLMFRMNYGRARKSRYGTKIQLNPVPDIPDIRIRGFKGGV